MKVDRRRFLSMFAASAVGMTAAAKLDLLEDMSKWALSPNKTIFIPPPPKLVVANYVWQEPTVDSIPEDLCGTEFVYNITLQMAYAK